MDALGITYQQLLTQLISFLVLFFLLYKLAYKPIIGMLDSRAEKIKNSLDAAENAKKDAESTAEKIEKEIGIKFIIKGQGDEYQRIKEIKEGNSSLIIPINYPKPYNVDDPFKGTKN